MSKMTECQTILFVNLYKSHPILWETTSPDYRNKARRQEALEAIIRSLNISGFTVSDCKNKIKNIRSHYCQELKKIKECNEGEEADFYTPTLTWFDTLDSFLRKHVQQNVTANLKRKSSAQAQYQEDDIEDDGQQLKDNLETTDYIEDAYAHEIYLPPSIKEEFISTPITPKKRRQASLVPEVRRALKQLTEISNSVAKRKTEFDVFATSVAAQLNNMPWENAAELQLQIQELITKYRLNLHGSDSRHIGASTHSSSDSSDSSDSESDLKDQKSSES